MNALRLFVFSLKCLLRLLRFTLGSQPHDNNLPWLHAFAMLCATPADDTAYANALSLYPVKQNYD